MNPRLTAFIEPLEPRIAPANLLVSVDGKRASWTDVDGDLVTLTSNKGIFNPNGNQFDFLPQNVPAGDRGSQLALLDLTEIFTDGVSLNFTARRDPVAKVGDGFVNVGWIKAFSDFTTIKVDGDLARLTVGNTIDATPAIASLTVHSAAQFGIATQVAAVGDLVGGEAARTDWHVRGRIGTLLVKGDFFANLTLFGQVEDAAGSIGAVTVWGDIAPTDKSLTANPSGSTGHIGASGAIGAVRVLGNIAGGPDRLSGSIASSATITSVWIGGNLTGGTGDLSGVVIAAGRIGSVSLGGSLFSGGTHEVNGQTVPSDSAGSVSSGTSLGKVTVKGDVVGGSSFFGGSIYTLPGGGGKIDSVTIGGRLAGATKSINLGTGPQVLFNGIYSDGQLGPVKVGTIQGLSPAESVSIIARGMINPKTPAEALAIASITVARGVASANILAGYNSVFEAVNPDVQIGAVKVGANWLASNLIAGVVPGASHLFGGDDDAVITPVGPITDKPAILAKIASFTVVGYLVGSIPTTDTFGIEAQLIGAVKIGATVVPMSSGPFTPGDDFLLGVTHDVRIREV